MGDLLSIDKVSLRALEPSDIDFLCEMENDTSAWKMSNTLAPFSRFQIEQYVFESQNDPFANRQLRLMIDYSENTDKPVAVGAVDLFEVDPLHRRAGVGILVNLPYREKGVASLAMEILVKYAFETLNLHQLYCNISADNVHSIRLFEKLGFLPCGLKKDWILDGGRWKDEWIYQLLNHAT